MQDLSGLISAAVSAKMTPEFIEKEVDSRVEKLVVEAIGSALRSYSDTGKLIEKAVADALRVERLDIPSYGSVVTAMLKAKIEEKVAPIVAGKLAEDMDALLNLAPTTIKLSKIAEGMVERYREYHHDAYGDCITVIVEPSSGNYYWIYLDDSQHLRRSDKHSAECRIGIDDKGKIFHATIGGRDMKSAQYMGRGESLLNQIRAFYAVGTVIEIDEDNVSVGVGDY